MNTYWDVYSSYITKLKDNLNPYYYASTYYNSPRYSVSTDFVCFNDRVNSIIYWSRDKFLPPLYQFRFKPSVIPWQQVFATFFLTPWDIRAICKFTWQEEPYELLAPLCVRYLSSVSSVVAILFQTSSLLKLLDRL